MFQCGLCSLGPLEEKNCSHLWVVPHQDFLVLRMILALSKHKKDKWNGCITIKKEDLIETHTMTKNLCSKRTENDQVF